jgi:hypothetical protein
MKLTGVGPSALTVTICTGVQEMFSVLSSAALLFFAPTLRPDSERISESLREKRLLDRGEIGGLEDCEPGNRTRSMVRS